MFFSRGQPGDTALEPSGPGVPEVISVDDSIVLVLKPNELAKKKRKFKQVAALIIFAGDSPLLTQFFIHFFLVFGERF